MSVCRYTCCSCSTKSVLYLHVVATCLIVIGWDFKLRRIRFIIIFFFVQACTRCTSLIFAVNSVCALSMNIDVTFKREGLYFNLIFYFCFLDLQLQSSAFFFFFTFCDFVSLCSLFTSMPWWSVFFRFYWLIFVYVFVLNFFIAIFFEITFFVLFVTLLAHYFRAAAKFSDNCISMHCYFVPNWSISQDTDFWTFTFVAEVVSNFMYCGNLFRLTAAIEQKILRGFSLLAKSQTPVY